MSEKAQKKMSEDDLMHEACCEAAERGETGMKKTGDIFTTEKKSLGVSNAHVQVEHGGCGGKGLIKVLGMPAESSEMNKIKWTKTTEFIQSWRRQFR